MLNQNKNLIFAALFTGVYDVNRNETLQENNFSLIEDWYQSIIALKLDAIVFHNTFNEATVQNFENDHIKFKYVPLQSNFNPNIFRYFAYLNYILANKQAIANIFITDITDVTVVKNPFKETFFIDNSNKLFCGDEPKLLTNEWMYEHNTHLRNSITNFEIYESTYAKEVLLNCGIIGGSIKTMTTLISEIVQLHSLYNSTNKSPFTLDMGVFNYVARTIFPEKILHGPPINTAFKAYQVERRDCWFRHK